MVKIKSQFISTAVRFTAGILKLKKNRDYNRISNQTFKLLSDSTPHINYNPKFKCYFAHWMSYHSRIFVNSYSYYIFIENINNSSRFQRVRLLQKWMHVELKRNCWGKQIQWSTSMSNTFGTNSLELFSIFKFNKHVDEIWPRMARTFSWYINEGKFWSHQPLSSSSDYRQQLNSLPIPKCP